MKRLFFYILRNFFGGKLFELWKKGRAFSSYANMRRKALLYNNHRSAIVDRIKHKDKIEILFFAFTMGMWKYDELLKLLSKRKDFNITIVPFIMPNNDLLFSKRNRDEFYEYCIRNGYNFRDGYDFSEQKYLIIKDINPDIVIYSQPYNLGYKPWLIDSYKNNSLFIYTPYGASVSSGKFFYDTYLTNISWKIFAANILEEKVLLDNCPRLKNSIVITGCSTQDLLNKKSSLKNPWPDNNKKRVIWAPHHSIDARYSFSSSNFERICDEMLRIAKKYEDSIEFAFKPHPILRERLLEKWGKEKTDEYYESWHNLSNGEIYLDDYAALFAYSDAMIHDCASFASEYLLTQNPVMYICQDEIPKAGLDNSYGIECFKQHYHGFTIVDIERFLTNVVLNSNDYMSIGRIEFVEKYLKTSNTNSVAQNMLNSILLLR